MREFNATLEAISFRKRGIKLDGQWYDAGEKVNLDELERNAKYQVFVSEDGKTVLEMIRSDKPQTEAKSRKRTRKAEDYRAVLEDHKRCIEQLQKDMEVLKKKIENGNGFVKAFDLIATEYSDQKRRIDNLETWAVITIQQVVKELNRLKAEIDILKQSMKEVSEKCSEKQ